MVSGTRCPYVGVCKNEPVRGAAALEGPMTYDSTLRLEAMDQSQRTAHRSMLECVYMWQRPREKVS